MAKEHLSKIILVESLDLSFTANLYQFHTTFPKTQPYMQHKEKEAL